MSKPWGSKLYVEAAPRGDYQVQCAEKNNQDAHVAIDQHRGDRPLENTFFSMIFAYMTEFEYAIEVTVIDLQVILSVKIY